MSLIPEVRQHVLAALETFAAGTAITGENTGLSAVATGSFTTAKKPILPGTVSITPAGGTSQAVTDDGAGKLKSASDGASGTVNYTTGEITYTMGGTATGTISVAYKHGEAYQGDISLADQGQPPYAANMGGYRMKAIRDGKNYLVEVKVSQLH
jgi:hypothetical protein